MRIIVVAALLLAVATGCGGEGDDSPDSGQETAISEALSYVPAEAAGVMVVDVAAAEERLGLRDVDADSSVEDREAYAQDLADEAEWVGHDLMLIPPDDAQAGLVPEVEWAATVFGESSVQIYRMSDALDLDTVADDLRDRGFTEEDETEDSVRLSIDLGDLDEGAILPSTLYDVTLVPDEHLLVTGPDADAVLSAVAGDVDPLSATEGVEQVTPDDAELGIVTTSTGCGQTFGADAPGLGSPRIAITAVDATDDGVATTSRLAFADSDAAADDAVARAAYLRQGRLQGTGQDFASVFTVDDVSTDGSVETVDFTLSGEPAVLTAMLLQQGLPFHQCGS